MYLREGANAIVNSHEPQIRRMKALSTRPGSAEMAARPPLAAAPLSLRRPGMAARWKGQHRLAFTG